MELRGGRYGGNGRVRAVGCIGGFRSSPGEASAVRYAERGAELEQQDEQPARDNPEARTSWIRR
jgi:hypothetical protein